MKRKTWWLVGYIAVCLVLAVYQVVLHLHHAQGSRDAELLATTVAALFLVLWIDADSRGRPEIYRPFEYGYLVLLLWLPYLPYYLWRTRKVRGLFEFAGLVLLFFAGDFVQFGL